MEEVVVAEDQVLPQQLVVLVVEVVMVIVEHQELTQALLKQT